MIVKSRTAVRASSWGSLFDCAYKWEWETLLKHRKPSGMPAVLGTGLHASTAVFDAALVEGKPIKPGDAADVLIEKLHHPEFEVDYARSRRYRSVGTINGWETMPIRFPAGAKVACDLEL